MGSLQLLQKPKGAQSGLDLGELSQKVNISLAVSSC